MVCSALVFFIFYLPCACLLFAKYTKHGNPKGCFPLLPSAALPAICSPARAEAGHDSKA